VVADTEVKPYPIVRTVIPARLDRLRWSAFRTRKIIVLGVAWILDALEITLVAPVANLLAKKCTPHMSARAVGVMASV